MKSNPLRILRLLDGFLTEPQTLYVYGRSALALGFPDAPQPVHATMDVDAILPARDLLALEGNDDFWQAQARTNEALAGDGLYFTHLFVEHQVILSADWLEFVVPLSFPEFRRIRLFRPATADLILTKMMRVDPQDREDIRFLLAQPDCDRARLRASLAHPRIPDVPELREAFAVNHAWLVSLL